MRLHVNIDHIATIRQARRTDEPDPVRAAVLVETENKPDDSPALEIPPKINSKGVPPTND